MNGCLKHAIPRPWLQILRAQLLAIARYVCSRGACALGEGYSQGTHAPGVLPTLRLDPGSFVSLLIPFKLNQKFPNLITNQDCADGDS